MTREDRKRIVENLMTDVWTSSARDYIRFTPEECETQLEEMRKYNIDLEPEDRIPDDMTGAEVYELWNEIVEEYWKDLRAPLREYLLGEGNYDYTFNKYLEACRLNLGSAPHPWVYCGEIAFRGKDNDAPEYSAREFASIARRSPDFDPDKPFYWFDGNRLHSADNVFPQIANVDEVIDYIARYGDDLDVCEIADIL